MAYVRLTSRPYVLAQVIRGALEAEGLDARVDRNGLGAVYGLDSGYFATWISVAEGDLERARALLADAESGA